MKLPYPSPAMPPKATGLLLGILVFVTIGCSRPLPPGKVRAKGIVTLAGKQLQVGSISLASKTGSESAIARIAQDGGFEVVISPGEYHVAVVSKDGFDRMDERGKVVPAKSLVSERYGSTGTSGLTVTVTTEAKPLRVALD